MTTIALVEDSRAFVCTSQLLCVVTNFLATALLAALGNNTGSVHIILRERLHL